MKFKASESREVSRLSSPINISDATDKNWEGGGGWEGGEAPKEEETRDTGKKR